MKEGISHILDLFPAQDGIAKHSIYPHTFYLYHMPLIAFSNPSFHRVSMQSILWLNPTDSKIMLSLNPQTYILTSTNFSLILYFQFSAHIYQFHSTRSGHLLTHIDLFRLTWLWSTDVFMLFSHKHRRYGLSAIVALVPYAAFTANNEDSTNIF